MTIYQNHRFDLNTAELIAGDGDSTWAGRTKKGAWFIYSDDGIVGATGSVDFGVSDFVDLLIEWGFAEVVAEHFPEYMHLIPEA